MYKGCLPAKRSSSFAKGEMARFESKIRSAPPFPAGALPFVTCLDEPLATSSPASRELPLKGKPLSGCKKEGASFGAPGRLATSSLVCNTSLCSTCPPSGGPGISLVVLRGLWVGCACAPRGEDSPKGYRSPEAQSRLFAGFGPYRVQRAPAVGEYTKTIEARRAGEFKIPPDPLALAERAEYSVRCCKAHNRMSQSAHKNRSPLHRLYLLLASPQKI